MITKRWKFDMPNVKDVDYNKQMFNPIVYNITGILETFEAMRPTLPKIP